MISDTNAKLKIEAAFGCSKVYFILLGFLSALATAQPTSASDSRNGKRIASAPTEVTGAIRCLSDLRSFHAQMQKDGYWLQEPGNFGYGYPPLGYPYSALATLPSNGANSSPAGNGYQRARSGYDVRSLIVAANILARRGQQNDCEALLGATRTIYNAYTADLRRGGISMVDVPGWRKLQVTSSQPVTSSIASYNADQLIGTDVVNPRTDVLGSVDDVVRDPTTGKIDYLMIGRGGIFGIDEKYIPIPWEDFKATNGAYLLVLDATTDDMKNAPEADKYKFSPIGDFAGESKKVDEFWKTHIGK